MLVLVVLLPMVSKADGVLPPHDGFPTIIHRMSEYEQEYKPKFWERADMKKIGETHKPEAKRLRQYATKKRKGEGAIFQF